MIGFYRASGFCYGLSSPTAMACNGRYDSGGLADRFAIQTQAPDRILAVSVKQRAMDDMGLV